MSLGDFTGDGRGDRSPRVVIGSPTCRAPGRLRTLLRSLRPQLHGDGAQAAGGVLVLVADGASDLVASRMVREYLPDVPTCVVTVTSPDESAARNALVRTALRMCRPFRWMIMLDDDCRVLPGWFEAFTASLDAVEAEEAPHRVVVAGPVHERAPGRAARGVHPAVAPAPCEADLRLLRSIRNVAIHRAVFSGLEPGSEGGWFPDELVPAAAQYDFLHRARRDGARSVWCARAAVVREPPSTERTARTRLRHAYALDREAAVVDSRYGGPVGSARAAGEVCRAAAGEAGHALRSRDAWALWHAGLGLARALGRAHGLVDATVQAAQWRWREVTAEIGGRRAIQPATGGQWSE